MHLLTEVFDLLHKEYDESYDGFMEATSRNDEIYDTMPDCFLTTLTSYEEIYYGAEDVEDYEDENLKPGTNELQVIWDLAYDLYFASWIIQCDKDRLVKIFHNCFVDVYVLAAFLALSRDTKELKRRIEWWKNAGPDNWGASEVYYLIAGRPSFFRRNEYISLYSKTEFFKKLNQIHEKEDKISNG